MLSAEGFLLIGLQASGNKSFLDGGLGDTLLCLSQQFLKGLSVGGCELGNKFFLEEIKLKLERWIGRSQIKKVEINFQTKEKVCLKFSKEKVTLYIKGIESSQV